MIRFAGLIAALFSISAYAGHEMGNGGLAWVCRDPVSHKIHKAELLDVAEFEMETGLAPIEALYSISDSISDSNSDSNSDSIRTLFVAGLKRAIRGGRVAADAEPAFLATLAQVEVSARWVESFPGQTVDWGETGTYFPGVNSNYACPISSGRLEQVAIDYAPVIHRLDIHRTLFAALSAASQNLLWLHEAVYRYRREHCGDVNSSITREVVREFLFSGDLAPWSAFCGPNSR